MMTNFNEAATLLAESTSSQIPSQPSALSLFGVIVVLGFFLTNLKGLLFSYHVRIFHALFNHLWFNRTRRINAQRHGVDAIFQPIVTTSRSPLLECDFNGHKSNSTFYSDLDVNRMHLFGALFKEVISPAAKPSAGQGLGKLILALGGVSCTFKREIKPYQKYQIWSRVLAWDEKWMYIASYFVKDGVILPTGYTLQPSVSSRKKKSKDGDEFGKAIFASAISKYVFKQGRKTIRPEEVFQKLNLIPATLDLNDKGDIELPHMDGGAEKETGKIGSEKEVRGKEGTKWGSKEVQEEKQRGLEIAKHFASLDELQNSPIMPSSRALGRFDGIGFC